ncbi:uncharacterized protein DFL_001477 [Arthrobotrys flagrans]|uniref:Uncharacterized protein n=1 Tax=Arthrobotrys flagrans TaxID=97331 RepID=A0A437A7R0_ARTFL|nr:hypothetical protein DFL_001477 [Arthrobotrys flagrans]
MSRPSGTGFLHPHSLPLFFCILFILSFYNRAVLAAPIINDIHINRRNATVSILCTKPTSPPPISTPTNIKTIIETTFATQTDVITRTIIPGGSSSASRVIVETTSTLTALQSGSPVLSEIGTGPGYVFSTPEYTTSSSLSISSYSTLSRPAITMIASPPVAVVPTNEPEERPVETSEVLTITTSIEPSTSMVTALPISTISTELIAPIEVPTISSSTSIITTSTSSTTTSPPQDPTDLPKTGYILTGIILPQPSDTLSAQSTRIQLDGGVSMPTGTGEVDLNGPPELVFRGDAGRGIRMNIGVWGVTGIVAVVWGWPFR